MYGEPLDLSEHHLAWYMANALPDIKAFPDGEYPYEEGQAGYRRYMVYDNLPIKGYAYPLDQVLAAHQMDIQADTFGGTVSICTECGYILHSFDQR